MTLNVLFADFFSVRSVYYFDTLQKARPRLRLSRRTLIRSITNTFQSKHLSIYKAVAEELNLFVRDMAFSLLQSPWFP